MFRAKILRIAPLALAVAAGCSGSDGVPREPIAGTVAIDGQPIKQGLITFTPEQAEEPVVSAVIEDGRFALDRVDGPTHGPQRVQVWSRQATGKQVKDPDDPKGPKIDEIREVVPARYNVQTELKAEVKPDGDNTFPFELKGGKALASRGRSGGR